YGIMVDSTAESIGLKNGDMILAVDGHNVERFNKIVPEIIFNEAKTLNVMRNGEITPVTIPQGTIRKIIKSRRNTFIQPRTPVVVEVVSKKSEAERMGLKENDSIVAVNGQPVRFYDQFEDLKQASAGQLIALTVMRNGSATELNGTVPEDKILGFGIKGPSNYFTFTRIKYGPIQAVSKGFTFAFQKFGDYWQQLKLIFTSKEIDAKESVGGIVSFGKLFSPVF